MHTYKELAEYCAAIYGNRKLLIVPYAYNLTFNNLAVAGASGGTQTQQLSISANADFVFTECFHTGAVNLGNTQDMLSTYTVAASVLITDSGSGEQFMNSPILLENYSSTLDFKRPLAFPRFIQGRTSLSIQLANVAAVDTYATVDLSLRGALVRAFTEI